MSLEIKKIFLVKLEYWGRKLKAILKGKCPLLLMIKALYALELRVQLQLSKIPM